MKQNDGINKKQPGHGVKVLIFEPHVNGHRGPYLHWMTTGLVERGFEVIVVTLPEAMAHPLMKALAQIEINDGQASLHLIGERSATLPSGTDCAEQLIKREFAYWHLFKTWYKIHKVSVRPDIVFVPYMDYCLYAIGLLGSPFSDCPWVGLSMRPSFHYRCMGVNAPRPTLAAIKKVLFFQVLRNRYLKHFLTIDEPLVDYLGEKWLSSGKVVFFPEPASIAKLPSPVESKKQFGIAPNRKIILLYGSITARKGVIDLIRALASPDFPEGADVLLAGRVFEPAVQKLLAAPWVLALCAKERLKVIDRFIEPAEESVLFAAADIVWLGYREHYNSSGFLVQAVKAARPVLACEEGVLGWQTGRHGLGLTIRPENTAAVAAAVHLLLKYPLSKTGQNMHNEVWVPPSLSEAQDSLAHILGFG